MQAMHIVWPDCKGTEPLIILWSILNPYLVWKCQALCYVLDKTENMYHKKSLKLEIGPFSGCRKKRVKSKEKNNTELSYTSNCSQMVKIKRNKYSKASVTTKGM